MPTTLTTEIDVKSRGLLQEAIAGIGTPKLQYEILTDETLVDGTGNSQADKIGANAYDIAGGAALDLDLSNFVSTLTGHTKTIRFTNVKALILINRSTASGNVLLVGAASTDPWSAPFNGEATSKVQCPPDSVLLLTNLIAGWAVSLNSSDILRIVNNGASQVSIEVGIVGVGT